MAKSKKDEASKKEVPAEEAETKEVPVDAAEQREDSGTDSVETDPQQEEQPVAESLEAALSAEKDRYLRLAAEYDNFRKRSIKEREAVFGDVKSDTIVQLLPVYDNLERALKHECSDEAFYKGVEMTLTQMKDILKKLGVTEIKAVGEKFNPERHNAVMHIEDTAYGEKEITEEFEKGFMLGERVIRFSMVKVAN